MTRALTAAEVRAMFAAEDRARDREDARLELDAMRAFKASTYGDYRAVLRSAVFALGGQAELARRLGRSQGTISRWLAGRRPIPGVVRDWLARRYG